MTSSSHVVDREMVLELRQRPEVADVVEQTAAKGFCSHTSEVIELSLNAGGAGLGGGERSCGARCGSAPGGKSHHSRHSFSAKNNTLDGLLKTYESQMIELLIN